MSSVNLAAVMKELQLLRKEVEFVRTHCATYVGSGIAIAYLADETPIYVNSQDYGGPSNIINGGRYEEENLAVLLSFCTDKTVFLDIGANIGFFSLQLGRRLHRAGKVHAFEPHPLLSELACRSAFLNGLSPTITVHRLALSNSSTETSMYFPAGHLGGGALTGQNVPQSDQTMRVKVETLDNLMGPDFRCDLVKIDVEGHELYTLLGMEQTLLRSKTCKILFEKLGIRAGYEDEIEAFFKKFSYSLWLVGPGAQLEPLAPGSLKNVSGYLLAAPSDMHIEPNRARFSIYPTQCFGIPHAETLTGAAELSASGDKATTLFHGPYWFLPRGIWRVSLKGKLRGDLTLQLACRFGHIVASEVLRENKLEAIFTCNNDLVQFECVGLSLSWKGCHLELERLDFERMG